jgi:Putative adhesin
MRRLNFAVVTLILAWASLVHADDWSKTYKISGKPDLRVRTSDANLHVDTWDQNTIDVHVTSNHYKIGEGGIQISEHQNGDSVEIELRYPHHNFAIQFGGDRYRVDVDIRMPREGKVDLHTGDGAIRLANFKGEMELATGDGHQDIDTVDGVLRARAGDGHIRATGRFDGLNLETGDGRIEARALAGSSMTSSWNVHTGDGSVTLQLPENFAADVDFHTSDGHVDVDFPVTVEGRMGDKNIRGKINGGGNVLTVHTGDGSIRIEKS